MNAYTFYPVQILQNYFLHYNVHLKYHGLYGDGASDYGFVGIEFPNGVVGDKGNIKLRFDDTYMKMAAEGKL
jgi:hypothetical protein